METYNLDHDIKVFCVRASSFPEGILEAHQKLHSLIPFSTQRKYFGISRPEGDLGIVYRAAAEELTPGETEALNLEIVVLKKGNYTSAVIYDYMKDLSSIGSCFDKLLMHPDIDPQGYCVEWYLNEKDVRCMVRLAD